MKDRDQTKRKLIDAVGTLIKTNGFDSLRISKVAREAGVDRKLIYRYFGNLDNLTEAYVIENDYWMIFADHLKQLSESFDENTGQITVTKTLQSLFKYFLKETDMQNLILMELMGSSHIMRSIHNVRESMGRDIFEKSDAHFDNSGVNFRAVAGLLIGGIYYMVLHTISNGKNFTDVDLGTEEGKEEINRTLSNVINWAFEAAAKR